MNHFAAAKPLTGFVTLLLLMQLACLSSSVSLTNVPAASTSPQPVPITGQQTTAAPTRAAGSQPAPSDAEAMLQAVVQHYQAVGRDRALQDFTNQAAPFNSDSLFVLCIGKDDKISALGGNPLFIGLSADQLSDNSGQFGQLLWLLASAEPKGSLPFVWVDPMSAQQQSKVMYYQRLSEDVCGVVADKP